MIWKTDVDSRWLVFGAAFMLRLIYLLIFVEHEHLFAEDQMLYLMMAEIFGHEGLIAVPAERVPGYPMVLWVFTGEWGVGYWGLLVAQAAADAFTCVIIGVLTGKVLGRGFLMGGALSVLNLNMVVNAAMILPDSIFLMGFSIFLLQVWLFFEKKATFYYCTAIGALATGTMIRPATYYLIPVIVIGLAFWGAYAKKSTLHGVKLVFAGALIFTTVLAPQHWRNWDRYGSIGFVSQGGAHLLGWVVPATYQYAGHGAYQTGQELARERLNAQLAADGLFEAPQNPFEASLYKAAVAKALLDEFGAISLARAWIVGAGLNMLVPSAAFAPTVRAMDHPSFYGTPGAGIMEKLWNYVSETSGFLYLAILSIGTVTQGAFCAAFLVGWWALSRDAWTMRKLDATAGTLISLTAIILYFLAITGPIIGSKYRLPLEPIMTVFAVAGYYRVR